MARYSPRSLPLRFAFGLLVVLTGLAVGLPNATAQDKKKKIDKAAEERARGLITDAMEQDYLGVNFKAAEAKLDTARRVCELVCSQELTARIHRNLGVVYAGMERHEDAVEQFRTMIKIDAKLGLDPNYVNSAVQKAYDEAIEKSKSVLIEKSLAVLEEDPWAEQATWSPVPVYVTPPADLEATIGKVVVRFRPPGSQKWVELELPARGEGFGGYIPCAHVEKEGELVYFTTAFDDNLDRVASGGSAKDPRRVKLKKSITGRQPSLPGATPPSPCPRDEERLSCEVDDDCPGAQLCVDLVCVDESTIPKNVDPRAHVKLNWISVAFSPDLMVVKSKDSVCTEETQRQGQFACFFAGDIQVANRTIVDDGSANSTVGGIGLGSMRATVGYDRVFLKRYVAGARAGFAFLGHPKADIGAGTFLPIHGEARFAFHILSDPFANKFLRPYVFANGGIAEANALVTTDVTFETETGNQTASVDVYQVAGPAFVGGGLGVQYAALHEMALVLEVGVRQNFGTSGLVLAPSLGVAYGL